LVSCGRYSIANKAQIKPVKNISTLYIGDNIPKNQQTIQDSPRKFIIYYPPISFSHTWALAFKLLAMSLKCCGVST